MPKARECILAPLDMRGRYLVQEFFQRLLSCGAGVHAPSGPFSVSAGAGPQVWRLLAFMMAERRPGHDACRQRQSSQHSCSLRRSSESAPLCVRMPHSCSCSPSQLCASLLSCRCFVFFVPRAVQATVVLCCSGHHPSTMLRDFWDKDSNKSAD